nr:mandelate racemase/muconate lactonizing enzyme family protein [Leisingera aquimarina]
MEAEDGTIGYGETTTAPDADGQKLVLQKLARSFVGRSVFDYAMCEMEAFRGNFLTFGGNMPRFANQLFCGLEMAALDLQGKTLGRPVWDLLGGAKRSEVGYFYFLQGKTVEALAEDAKAAVAAGNPIIYLKVGVGEAHDMAAVKAVREAIGGTRLRLDANEAWDPATALRMLNAFAPYNIEYVEQPTPSWSIPALKHLKERSPIALGADQSVFTIHDVYQACSTRAPDMIAVGPREVGGLRAMMKAAAIAEGAGLNICIHSSMTTGITTCAEHHIARAIPNLDDGNQLMWQLLQDNIVSNPGLTPIKGKLSFEPRPGLGFDLDHDMVAKAAERHEQFTKGNA